VTPTLTTVAPQVAKLVRLLGSDNDGEVVACVAALRRVLHGAGLDLHDLARAVEVPIRVLSYRPPSYQPRSYYAEPSVNPDLRWRDMVTLCVERECSLTERQAKRTSRRNRYVDEMMVWLRR